ncbi:MAG: hypothetical protein DRO11_00755 [Methanobacteriota archaeon]|nr:MAG: hypothetical protein DRO11_00755 [Euryarchaeota archaeon]
MAIREYVEGGGGLLVLGKPVSEGGARSNRVVNQVAGEFGVRFGDASIMGPGGRRSRVVATLDSRTWLGYRNPSVVLYGASPVYVEERGRYPDLRVVGRTGPNTVPSKVGVIISGRIGRGRVVFIGDTTLFTNGALQDSPGNLKLLESVVEWLSQEYLERKHSGSDEQRFILRFNPLYVALLLVVVIALALLFVGRSILFGGRAPAGEGVSVGTTGLTDQEVEEELDRLYRERHRLIRLMESLEEMKEEIGEQTYQETMEEYRRRLEVLDAEIERLAGSDV